MRVVLRGTDLPGRNCGPYENVHVGLQVGREPHGLVRADADAATWETEVDVITRGEALDFRGPAVHGRRGERFLYLTWGEVRRGDFVMFRRAKLLLADVGPEVRAAVRATGVLSLTDTAGMPLCARVKPPVITWTLEQPQTRGR